MTIIVSWFNRTALYVVADSRLFDTERHQPLLDCGAKLFSIRLVCVERHSTSNNIQGKIFYTDNIGFAFAGSSLIALNLQAFLSYSLGNIINFVNSRPPLLAEVARHCAAVFKRLLMKYKESPGGVNLKPCEVSIFGNCPQTGQCQLFHITVEENTLEATNLKVVEVDFSESEFVHIMGNHQKEIKNLIHEYRAKNMHREDVPQQIIEKIIQEETFPTIGGEIQLGIVWPQLGFKSYPVYRPDRPIERGQPKVVMLYQGIDLLSDNNLMSIGDSRLNIHALPVGYNKWSSKIEDNVYG